MNRRAGSCWKERTINNFAFKWSSIAGSKFLLDTQDLEPITGFTVHKVLSLDLDGNDGAGSGRESADRREKANVSLQIVSVYQLRD